MVKKTVPKKLTFMSIYFLGINGIIGSGAFLLPQSIYKDMNLLSVIVLLSAALTVGLIALCYADLASRFTGSGAAWLYSYNAFGRFAGYELGVFTWFLGCCTYAAEVVAFLTTLKSFVPAFNQSSIYFAVGIGLILLFSIINFFGRALVKVIDNTSSIAKLSTIIHCGWDVLYAYYELPSSTASGCCKRRRTILPSLWCSIQCCLLFV